MNQMSWPPQVPPTTAHAGAAADAGGVFRQPWRVL